MFVPYDCFYIVISYLSYKEIISLSEINKDYNFMKEYLSDKAIIIQNKFRKYKNSKFIRKSLLRTNYLELYEYKPLIIQLMLDSRKSNKKLYLQKIIDRLDMYSNNPEKEDNFEFILNDKQKNIFNSKLSLKQILNCLTLRQLRYVRNNLI